MNEVRLVVRENGKDWSGIIAADQAKRVVAALSADPVTLAELEVAAERFMNLLPGELLFDGFTRKLRDDPHDEGLVVIDLIARLVLVDADRHQWDSAGYVSYLDKQDFWNASLAYQLADDWLFVEDRRKWRALAKSRRCQAADDMPRIARDIFYGMPMLTHVAHETFLAFAQRDLIEAQVRQRWIRRARVRLAKHAGIAPNEVDPALLTEEQITPKSWSEEEIYSSPFYDALKEIHASWLLTPRAEWGGQCPRTVALQHLDHLTCDLEDRSDQWSSTRKCPRGLDKSSFAYRYGGFGTHEWITYYELMRALLWDCWKHLADSQRTESSPGKSDPEATEQFVAAEVPRLEAVRDEWLDRPDPQCHHRTPRMIIELERQRIPLTAHPADATPDSDCPCCQSIRLGSGPTFWHYDTSAMDDHFAFDLYCETPEEWEEQHDHWKVSPEGG